MNANTTISREEAKAIRRAEFIALAREIHGKFAKLHALMDNMLARAHLKKAA